MSGYSIKWQTQRRTKKKVKSVVDGIAHIHASFNNTIVTITDRQGNALCVGDFRWFRFPWFAQKHAVRGPGCGREGR